MSGKTERNRNVHWCHAHGCHPGLAQRGAVPALGPSVQPGSSAQRIWCMRPSLLQGGGDLLYHCSAELLSYPEKADSLHRMCMLPSCLDSTSLVRKVAQERPVSSTHTVGSADWGERGGWNLQPSIVAEYVHRPQGHTCYWFRTLNLLR